MQELLRHSSLRSTLDIYTQALTPVKHAAQAAVLSLVFLPRQTERHAPRHEELGALEEEPKGFKNNEKGVQKGRQIGKAKHVNRPVHCFAQRTGDHAIMAASLQLLSQFVLFCSDSLSPVNNTGG
jgi:hypothetical protein